MIFEAIQHFITPAPEYIKKMGYLREAIAIEARAKRCKNAWQPHLDKCKELIATAVGNLRPQSNIMIVGSGGLHDVPCGILLSKGHNITYVDVIHFPQVIKKNKEFDFITRDITGLIEPLYEAIKIGKRVKADPPWEPIKTPDLIISLNLLSQLAMKLVEYAEHHGEDLGILFTDNVIKAHVQWLQNQNKRVLLISDIHWEYWASGKISETVTFLPDIGLKSPDESWYWDIAPKGEADREISIRHKVGAWHF
jgi:hypothetical protein